MTQPAKTEWPEPMRVAHRDDPSSVMQDDRERPAHLAQRIDDAGQQVSAREWAMRWMMTSLSEVD
jgi:hypothetical protein